MKKECRGCLLHLELAAFPINARYKDGRDIRCKTCCAEKTKAWRAKNPGAARASERKWKENNPELFKAAMKRRRARRVAKFPYAEAEATSKWRAQHLDLVRDYAREWARKNPEKCAAKSSERRAAKLRAIPPWLSDEHHELIAEKYAEAKRLSKETGVKYHVDHEIPLKGKAVSGLHVPWNLQVIPATVNQRKWNKLEGAAP